MRIKRMKAAFGMLDGREVELRDGMNVIYAPNESGKTTWCAFIRAMLYGIDSSERERSGYKPDKTKFAPWNGSAMEGEMDIEHNCREITLRRSGKPGAPMRNFSATYTGTGDAVPGLNGQNAGEALTGATRAVFERSAFIRQSGVAVGGSPELSRIIASVVSAGEDEISFSEADERLRAWQRKRRHNNWGMIPEIESEEERLRQKLREVQSTGEKKITLEEQLDTAERKKQELVKAVEERRKLERRDALERMSKGQNELKARQAALDEARNLAVLRQSELKHSLFGEKSPDEIREQTSSDAKEAERLRLEINSRITPVLAVLLAVLCLGASVLGAVCLAADFEFFAGFGAYSSALAAFAVGGAFLISAIITIIKSVKKREIARNAQTMLDELLGRYGVRGPEGIPDSLEIHERLWSLYIAAKRAKEDRERELENARSKQKELDAQLLRDLDFSSGEGEAARLGAKLTDQESELRLLREELAFCVGELKARGDPMVIESELQSLMEKRVELLNQYEALGLAIDIMNRANTEIQTRFSPRLGQRAGELMSTLTSGRYCELRIDKDLNTMARLEGDTMGRASAYLSEGAAGAMYLALRIAICELALPQDDPCPLILDDALVNFDDERLSIALDLLLGISKHRQVILFTCHKREARFLSGRDGVNIINTDMPL